MLDRAAIGVLLPGPFVLLMVLGVMMVAVALALAAPSEQMVDWASRPSPLQRIVRLGSRRGG
jgi:hypothetical protein